MRVTKYNTDT
jgi:sphinganine-1-phosphate aldolase